MTIRTSFSDNLDVVFGQFRRRFRRYRRFGVVFDVIDVSDVVFDVSDVLTAFWGSWIRMQIWNDLEMFSWIDADLVDLNAVTLL